MTTTPQPTPSTPPPADPKWQGVLERVTPSAAKTKLPEKPGISRRGLGVSVALGWAMICGAAATAVLMFQDFMGLKAPREPRKRWRVGRLDDFAAPGAVSEKFVRTEDGSSGFWLVNLSPKDNRLVAISVICTHLGCVPTWLRGDQKFKCPCHGSGFYTDGVNFEGPAPRPLERFGIKVDADGYVWVDQSQVFRQELGQWEHPDSFVTV